MKNVINITECDNKLFIYAVSSDEQTTYRLGIVGSGPAVNVNIALESGVYETPKAITNPTGTVNTTVKLPKDTYTLYYSGLNLGGPYNYSFTLNGTPYDLKNDPKKPLYGFIWNRGGSQPSDIKVVID